MEHNAELEDEDRSHLRRVVLDRLSSVLFDIMLHMFACVAEMVGAGGVAALGGCRGVGADGFGVRERGILGEGAFFGVCVVVPKGGEAHSHELSKKEEEDGDEGDAFDPIVFCDGAGEAGVREGDIGWGQELRRVSQCSMLAQ